MLTVKNTTQLLKSWDAGQIEKHCVFQFLYNSNIDYTASTILSDYLNGFEKTGALLSKINLLNIDTLKKLENCLELIIPAKDRKLNGAFFTPKYIVDFIIQTLSPKKNETNLDPSCGSGAFLIGLLDFYKEKHDKSIKDTIRENIYGVDLMGYNIRRAKLLLAIYALLHNEVLEDKDFNLKTQDSIRADWDTLFPSQRQFDNLAGNPPYVKFQDLPEINRKYLSKKSPVNKNGTFNLYFSFFELGYNLLKDTGKLGYITPNNYFTSLAGEPLRSFFQEKKCIFRVVDFKDKKVFDAQTYTALTFLNKQKNEELLYDRIPEGLSPEAFTRRVNGSPNKVGTLNPKKWRLLKSSEQKNIKIIENTGTPIGKLFTIATGVATLKDEVYFLDTTLATGNYYIKKINGKNFPIEKELTKVIYKISDFKSQSDIVTNTRRILFPYKRHQGKIVPYTEEELQQKYPKTYAYFCAVREKLAQRDKGKKIEPFYAYGRSQGLSRKGKMILTPTFSQYPRFLVAPKEDAFFCNGYGIFYNTDSQGLLDAPANPITKKENIKALQKILNAALMHYYVTVTSVSIQGGYPCYQKNFIEKFTIPDFSEKEIATLNQLKDKAAIDEFLIQKYQVNLPAPKRIS